MTNFQPVPQNKTNTMAIVGFVLSLACCGFVGAILSGLAIGQINRTGENGKGLAIAGMVIGILTTLAGFIYAIVYFFVMQGTYY
jgi:hypothetical protein